MENLKLYQYKDLAKVDSFTYNGKLATELIDDSRYNISSPVNTTENVEEVTDSVILTDTLSNKSGQLKFSFSFKVHSDLLSNGTKFVCGIPGLMEVKTEDNVLAFLFGFDGSPTWKYCKPNNLIIGWNNISLVGNGSTITLIINDNSYDLILGHYTKRIYSGFSDSNNIIIPEFFTSNMASFSLQTKINLQSATGINNAGIIDTGINNSGTNSTSIRLTVTTDGYLRFRVSSGGSQSYVIDITGSTLLPDLQSILVRVIYSSTSGYILEHSLDNGSSWIPDGQSSLTTRPYPSATEKYFCLGDNIATGYTLNGSLDLASTIFTLNGSEVFNGGTAIEGTDFTISGSLNVETAGGLYPDLITTQELYTKQSWLYLKDIEAINVDESN